MSSSHAEDLEIVLRSPKATGPDLKMALTRLSLEVKERVERGSSTSYDFFAATMHALSKIKGTAHAELRGKCLFDCASFFYITGHSAAAVQSSKLISNLAQRTNNKSWLRKANTMAGIVHADAGNVAESVVLYAKALQISRELNDRWSEVLVLLNLSGSLIYGALYQEALSCCRIAVSLSKDDPDLRRMLAATYTNMAQCYLYLEEYENGLDAVERALQVTDEPDTAAKALTLCIREFTYVLLALELGKLARAREHSARCREHSRWGDNPRGRVMADITAGLCEIHGGDVDRGLSFLDSALVRSNDFALRIDSLTALVKAYDEIGRPEEALKLMTDLLSNARALREKGVLALLAIKSDSALSWPSTSASQDLRVLELREAKLRTKVAEREIMNSRLEMLERLAVSADLREDASGEHGYRVGRLSALLAERLGWSEEACSAIDLAARLHDIGKIGVPDRILLNSRELKEAERHFMTTHTGIGAELLAKSSIPQLRIAEEIARSHHEWWDGNGYPSQLAGKRIPIHARIVALCDVFDALTHGRPYAAPWSIERALEEIRGRRGTQFDPDLTDHFLALVEKLQSEHADLDAYLGKAGRNSPFLQARNKIRLMLAEEREQERKATVTGTETRH